VYFCVLCLIVVTLPSGKIPFAVQLNNNNNNNKRYCSHLFSTMVLDRLVPSVQPQSFLEGASMSFEQPPEELHIIFFDPGP
jgi:hypothetical protein